MILTEKALNIKPELYTNLTDQPRIEKLQGGLIGSKIEPIVKNVNVIQKDLVAGTKFKVHHKLGSVHEVYARYRAAGTTAWQMFPTSLPTVYFSIITKTYLEVEFFGTPPASTCEFEFYFTGFKALK